MTLLLLLRSSAATGYTLTAETAAFSLTGAAAGLTYSGGTVARHRRQVEDADDLDGVRRLRLAHRLDDEDSVTWNPYPGSTSHAPLQPFVGAFTLTGNAATLTVQRRLAAAVGAFTLTGIDAGLTYSGGGYTLTAEPGAFTLTGVATGLRAARVLTGGLGAFTLTGLDATLTKAGAYTLTADAGTFTLTGVAATLRATRVLSAAVGTFTLTGIATGLTYSGSYQGMIRLTAARGPRLRLTPVDEARVYDPTSLRTLVATWDFTIDCSQDFAPNVDVERQATTTGDYEAYSGITGVTMHLAATEGGSAIHASLSQSAAERSGDPGRVYATFDVSDLQANLLPSYRNKTVYLVLTKSGELVGKSLRCLVTKNG